MDISTYYKINITSVSFYAFIYVLFMYFIIGSSSNIISKHFFIMTFVLIISIFLLVYLKYYLDNLPQTEYKDKVEKYIQYYYISSSCVYVVLGIFYLLLLGGLLHRIAHLKNPKINVSFMDHIEGLGHFDEVLKIRRLKRKISRHVNDNRV